MTTLDPIQRSADAVLATPFAWPESGLEPRPWFPFTVAASRGSADVAERVAQRTERAYWFLRKLFGFLPRFRLLVLDRADWPRYAEVPAYGVAHRTSPPKRAARASPQGGQAPWGGPAALCTAGGHLIVGSEPADAWREVSRYFAYRLPAPVVRSLVAVHGRDPVHPEGPDLSGIAEARVAHELAHLIAHQAGATFPRRWMAEAFANYALVAVLGETDPLGLHRIGTLAEAGSLLAGDTPSVGELDATQPPLGPVPSVLAQLALTRGVFAAYADERAEPLARWFAKARERHAPDADHEFGRMLARDVHPALAPIARDARRAMARAA